MKFLKKIFNRTTLVLLILLLEFAILIAAIYFGSQFSDPESYFSKNYPNLDFIGVIDDLLIFVLLIMQIIIFFRVIYRQMDAEFKIPWIIVLLALPLIGCIIYIIFSRKNLKSRDVRLLAASDGLGAKYFKEDLVSVEEYGDYHNNFKYLENNSILKTHNHNKIKYYKNGETFFPEFISHLEEAKEFVFLEFFIIGSGEEWSKIHDVLARKAKEGVEIRLLFDDLGCAGILPGNIIKILRKEGIKAYKFNKLRLIISGIYNNRDHRKIAVIDNKYGFTGGMNLADEYANIDSPFGYWKDTMIRIEGSAINNLIQLFLTNYDLCSRKTSDHAKYLNFDYPKFEDEGIIFPFGHGPAPVFKERVGEETLTNIINAAKKTLYISSPYFIPSESLLYSIRRAALNGVDVKLFLPGIPDKKFVYSVAQTYFKSLILAGVKIMIYRPGFNHMKTLVADDKIAFVGTINCDFRSLVHHFECGAIMYNCPCLKDIVEDFKEMEVESEQVPPTFEMKKIKIFFCALIKPFVALL